MHLGSWRFERACDSAHQKTELTPCNDGGWTGKLTKSDGSELQEAVSDDNKIRSLLGKGSGAVQLASSASSVTCRNAAPFLPSMPIARVPANAIVYKEFPSILQH